MVDEKGLKRYYVAMKIFSTDNRKEAESVRDGVQEAGGYAWIEDCKE